MCRLRVSVLRKVTAMEPQAPWSIYHATQIPWGEVIQTSPHATVERKRRGGGGQQWEKWDTPPKIHAHQEPECQNVLFFGNKILVDVISYDDEVLLHGGVGWAGGYAMTGVLNKEKGIHRDPGREKTSWRWRQRPGCCVHKPRNASCWQPQKLGERDLEQIFLRAWRGIRPADTWSQTLADRTVKDTFYGLKPRCVRELVMAPAGGSLSAVQYLLSHRTLFPPTLEHQHRRLGWKCFRGTLQLENGYAIIRHACWWGRREQRNVDEERTGASGRQERFGKKEERGVPGEETTWAKTDMGKCRCHFQMNQM